MIEDTRLITDLMTTAVRTKSRGANLISNKERAKYITTLRKIIPSIRESWRDHNSSIPGISGTAGTCGQKQNK